MPIVTEMWDNYRAPHVTPMGPHKGVAERIWGGVRKSVEGASIIVGNSATFFGCDSAYSAEDVIGELQTCEDATVIIYVEFEGLCEGSEDVGRREGE